MELVHIKTLINQNVGHEDKEVVLDSEDLHRKEDSVCLRTAGFQYYKQPTKRTSFRNNNEEITQLLLRSPIPTDGRSQQVDRSLRVEKGNQHTKSGLAVHRRRPGTMAFRLLLGSRYFTPEKRHHALRSSHT
ncbi:hypothetical protein CVT26_010268 [Gymnopilus dilepis]|uniref:Uncharacterized protein n=1 Tax=Gymnopilus dilepis TaxID=231916 RepID=A0A409Y116_9AGAR|nr:hypothetical protein CVT26_010268 [Gymnopilus dilepis]